MPAKNISLTDEQVRLLTELADESGESFSGMAAKCIDVGINTFCENANKRAVFLSMKEKRTAQRVAVMEDAANESAAPKKEKGK